jgi:hypothetical protein
MSAAIKIQLTGVQTVENQLHSRFLNFGEDVYRELRDTCAVNLGEIDSAFDHFVVRGIRRRDIGTVTQALNRIIRHHRLMDDVRLVRVDGPGPHGGADTV